MERMQESHDKGVANHVGPELCVASREAGCEAFVGARAGHVMSPESTHVGSADAVPLRGRSHPAHRYRETGRDSPGSKTMCMYGTISRATREIPGSSRRPRRRGAGAQREGQGRTPLKNEAGKSYSCVVPKKVSNKAWRRAAEGLEGRRLAKRNAPHGTTPRTLSWTSRTQGRAMVSVPTGGYGDAGEERNASPSDARQEPGAVVPHAGVCGGGGQQWPSLLRPGRSAQRGTSAATTGPRGAQPP